MGWTFYHKPKGVKVLETLRDHAMRGEIGTRIVAQSATRDAAFFVVKFHEPESNIYVPDADGHIRAILVFAIKNVPRARDGYNFGYKDMEESMGPYGCEAPLSIIAAASELRDPIGPLPQYASLRSARAYRERCRALAASKSAKVKMKDGQTVTFNRPLSFRNYGTESVFTVVKRGRKTLFRAKSGGFLCRLSAASLQSATIA